VLSKRVLAVSGDKPFAKRMAAGLMAAGATVEVIPSLDELPRGDIKADLVVLHAPDKVAERTAQTAARVAAGASLIVIIPSSSLSDTVGVMKAGRVAAVLVADEFEPARLAATATRLLHGDLFGLEKIVPWGVKVYSLLVGDYQEKSVAIAAVSDFAASIGVRRKYRESIEQCLDEMLMNALYDAPVDAGGKQMFADVPTKTRISLRMEQKATVEYACDGNIFALAVRDSFGTLRGETVLKYLDRCLHSEQQMERKTGGAGLGLYIISNAATQFLLAIHPRVATEATCTFDLTAPKVQLKSFGLFQERIDSSGRLVAGRSRLVTPSAAAPAAFAATGRIVNVALGAAIASVLALIFVVAYPRLKAPARGAVAVQTDPPGATVEVDGLPRGTTGDRALVVGDLVAGEKYKVVARKAGFEPTVELVSGREQPAPVLLALRPLAATLVLITTPPGASILVDGKEAGPSPLTLADLKPGSEHTVRVEKNGYNDLEQKVTVPEPGTRAEVQLALTHTPELSTIRIDSDPPGAELLQNGELLAGVKTPVADYMLQVGRNYTFTLRAAGYAPATVSVIGESGTTAPIAVKLKRGGMLVVDTGVPEARTSVLGVDGCQNRPGPVAECGLENGRYKVRVNSTRPYIAELFNVEVKGATVRHRVDLGFVETSSPDLTLKIPGAPVDTRRAAFTDGEHRVTLVNAKSGLTIIKPVRIVAGRTVTIGD
jgi:PEGA domain